METEFTPVASSLGGILIGLSAVLLLATTGRIAGISGILGRLLLPGGDTAGLPYRAMFVIGLLLAWPLWSLVAETPQMQLVASTPVLAVAGLVVGIGAGIGGGCTSGHGVCGLGRVSPRSIAATVTFMTTAAITVFVIRHVI